MCLKKQNVVKNSLVIYTQGKGIEIWHLLFYLGLAKPSGGEVEG